MSRLQRCKLTTIHNMLYTHVNTQYKRVQNEICFERVRWSQKEKKEKKNHKNV